MVSSIEVRSVGLCHATHFFFQVCFELDEGARGLLHSHTLLHTHDESGVWNIQSIRFWRDGIPSADRFSLADGS